jgi:hypothetical protein
MLIRFAILKHVIETLLDELTQTKEKLTQNEATTVILSAQLEATQKQVADMLLIMQTMGEKTGVPVQLPAPAPVQAPLVRHFTPISSIQHSVGIVGLRAVVIFGLRAVWIVGLRAALSCRLETSP